MSLPVQPLNLSESSFDENFWKELEQTPINPFPPAPVEALFADNGNLDFPAPLDPVRERMSISNLVNAEDSTPQPAENPVNVLQDISNQPAEQQVQVRRPAGYPNCIFCGEQFDLHSQLGEHLIIHHGYPPRRCYHCDFTCERLQNLKRHVKAMHDSRSVRYHCYACSFTTLCERDIRVHISSLHGQCPYCFCSFMRLSSHERLCRMHPRNQEAQNRAEEAGPAPQGDDMEEED